jgi:hypothetical protein
MFHTIWEGAVQGVNQFKPFRVDWWDVPGRDEKWKAETIANTSQLQFDQEFGNTFFGTGDTLISSHVLLEQRSNNPKQTLEGGDFLVYQEPQKNHDYVMCVDVGKGRGQDYSTFNIIDITSRPFEQVAVYRNNNISPILFPNIIHKYAKVYNESYVIIESNDQGALVANGLYQDLEYENLHMESSVKADRIGVEMNRKVKRLGCSGIKDIIETKKLKIHDAMTIQEMSTFVMKGVSYEASEGNHDDLMMNLVMFGYFATGRNFSELTNINLKEMMFQQRILEIENEMVPFGYIEDGNADEEVLGPDRSIWSVDKSYRADMGF